MTASLRHRQQEIARTRLSVAADVLRDGGPDVISLSDAYDVPSDTTLPTTPTTGEPVNETTDLPLADTSDMISMHRVFREALGAAPRFVGGTAPGDTQRAELVGSYYDNVLRLLDGHHAGEDELLTPKLLARCPDEAGLIADVFDQHQEVHGAIGRAHTCVGAWRADPSATKASALMAALSELRAALTPHLDEEERTVLPLAARCINVAEWGELPSHGMRTFSGDKLWLIRGLIRDQMTAPQRAAMDANTPPPVAAMWAESGEASYAAFITQLRGAVPAQRGPAESAHPEPSEQAPI